MVKDINIGIKPTTSCKQSPQLDCSPLTHIYQVLLSTIIENLRPLNHKGLNYAEIIDGKTIATSLRVENGMSVKMSTKLN